MAIDELTLSTMELEHYAKDKLQGLRDQMNTAKRESEQAMVEREKALAEVELLRQEKDALITEHLKIKDRQDEIRRDLQEHRKNLEHSLAQQEQKAQAIIDAASLVQAGHREREQLLRQRQAQLDGIRQTLQAECTALLPRLTEAFTKAQEALHAIPPLTPAPPSTS